MHCANKISRKSASPNSWKLFCTFQWLFDNDHHERRAASNIRLLPQGKEAVTRDEAANTKSPVDAWSTGRSGVECSERRKVAWRWWSTPCSAWPACPPSHLRPVSKLEGEGFGKLLHPSLRFNLIMWFCNTGNIFFVGDGKASVSTRMPTYKCKPCAYTVCPQAHSNFTSSYKFACHKPYFPTFHYRVPCLSISIQRN